MSLHTKRMKKADSQTDSENGFRSRAENKCRISPIAPASVLIFTSLRNERNIRSRFNDATALFYYLSILRKGIIRKNRICEAETCIVIPLKHIVWQRLLLLCNRATGDSQLRVVDLQYILWGINSKLPVHIQICGSHLNQPLPATLSLVDSQIVMDRSL